MFKPLKRLRADYNQGILANIQFRNICLLVSYAKSNTYETVIGYHVFFGTILKLGSLILKEEHRLIVRKIYDRNEKCKA
jgi:hypothetical protein